VAEHLERYVAFLRGMNLGRRRITNEELCSHIRELGFSNVSAFLASGNVVLDTPEVDAEKVARRVETGLSAALDYEVPVFIRTAREVRRVASYPAFPGREASDGKVHVAFFKARLPPAAGRIVLRHSTEDDRLVLHGREFYWWRRGSFLDSNLDLEAIEKEIGPVTVRTHRTIERLTARFSSE
jgi:uncharacterized protein (DUF1697 family)